MIATTSSQLADQLRARIQRDGPITFHEWMTAALYDGTQGYYSHPPHEIWGRAGDYRTSPERCSLFAATFARYFAQIFDKLGRPSSFLIAEMGGGNGEFAFGVLKTLRRYFPDVFEATRYVFDDHSARNAENAARRLQSFSDRVEFAHLSETPGSPAIVFSNELLDAFPVHRVMQTRGQLCEYYIALNAKEEFEWRLGKPSTQRLHAYLRRQKINLQEGQVAEINLAIENWLKLIAETMQRGYLITVDYGLESEDLYSVVARPQGTLRSFHKHSFAENILAAPGERDLTCTIDWTAVKTIGEHYGFENVQLVKQDDFLLQAGLLDQLKLESENMNEVDKIRLRTQAREMILPGGMAASYQVLVQRKADRNHDDTGLRTG